LNYHLITRTLFLFHLIALVSCVSVNLKPQSIKRSEGTKFTEPPPPFRVIENPSVDFAWQSSKTGNTLAYASECHNRSEITLDMMEQESLAAIMNARIMDSQTMEYNDREAKQIVAEGYVDGVAIKIAILLFKKNDCNYTLTFVGRKKHFDTEFNYFKKFKESFKAQ